MESRLALDFVRVEDRPETRMKIRTMTPPWKVVRAFPLPGGAALVHLNNVSGGILSRDRLHLDLDVGACACAQITSTGAARLYRSRGEEVSQSTVTVNVRDGALLEYLPDSTIPYAGSRYRQRTRIVLGPDAGLFWWEVLASVFAFALYGSRFELFCGEKPIAIENALLQPELRPLTSPARLDSFQYASTMYICRQGVPPQDWVHYEEILGRLAAEMDRPGESSWGVSALVSDGLVVRGLSRNGRDIPAALLSFWRTAKRLIYGQDPVAPRKIY
jgi:urease accessory protein